MKFFRLCNTEAEELSPPEFAATVAEMKHLIKAIPGHMRREYVVDEITVQIDKAGILSMLNRKPIMSEPIRTFAVTPRGGMKEV